MVKLEIIELKLLENVDLCSCYDIQHFCDIVFVPSSYDYEGLCNTIELRSPSFCHTPKKLFIQNIFI